MNFENKSKNKNGFREFCLYFLKSIREKKGKVVKKLLMTNL